MPRVPYTAAEFIEMMERDASLHGDYTQGLADIKEASEALNENLTAIQGNNTLLSAAVQELKDAAASFLESGAIVPKVVNDNGIVPTGSYANATYYNVDFGVKIAYDRAGDIYIIMKGGTTYDYEFFRFVAGTVPAGVTVDTVVPTSSSYATAPNNMLCVGIIHGVTKPVTMALVMGGTNSSYDYKDVTINLTEVDPEV